MKSPLYHLFLLSFLFGTLTLNVALADDVTAREINTSGIAVSFNDLNLADPAGLDSLYQRVESAAYEVCGVENFRVPLDVERKNRDCVSHSVDNATMKIDGVKFSAPHQPKLVAGIIGS